MPKISLIITTYNRAPVLLRAIDSVLKQDFEDWELIIVNDGSTDNTPEVLAQYKDPRIRVITYQGNRGVCAAKNIGLDAIQGEWFTFLDSDDEILPHALSTMLKVPGEIDPSIDAVSCNCLDSQTGEFTGLGLDGDQYLDAKTIIKRCRGEHWGLTKTYLLEDLHFNEKMATIGGSLWAAINEKARRYYIHKGLRIYHTEGYDRLSAKRLIRDPGRERRVRDSYVTLLTEETRYLSKLREHCPQAYCDTMFDAYLAFILAGDRKMAWQAYSNFCASGGEAQHRAIMVSGLIFGANWIRALRHINQRLPGKLKRV